MTPTLIGRIQTRILLLATVGLVWTWAISPALPRPGFASLGMVYRITLKGLLTVAVAGIGWEIVYHGLQQLRWDKDWPSILALVTMVNEGASTWLILHAFDVIPGTVGASSPILELFAIHFSTTWFLVWLATQGPLRVVVLRWRYEGARIRWPR